MILASTSIGMPQPSPPPAWVFLKEGTLHLLFTTIPIGKPFIQDLLAQRIRRLQHPKRPTNCVPLVHPVAHRPSAAHLSPTRPVLHPRGTLSNLPCQNGRCPLPLFQVNHYSSLIQKRRGQVHQREPLCSCQSDWKESNHEGRRGGSARKAPKPGP